MINIKIATKEDIDSWVKMRLELWSTSSSEEHRKELQEMVGTNTFQGWIAFEGDEKIGFAEASIRPFANGCENRPVVFFEGVWVRDSYRNKGVGREFVKAVEDWAKQKGIMEIGSDAELPNTLSHDCHQSWGFEETERVVYFRKKLK